MNTFNLHIFNDSVGFFSNSIAEFIDKIQPGNNRYMNTAKHCSNKSGKINYCNIDVFLKQHGDAKLRTVIFHSYNYFNKGFIKKIRNAYPKQSIKFVWIFWSHEYYQLPEFFDQLYQGFSRRLYLRKKLSFHVEQFRLFTKGEMSSPFYTGLPTFKKTFKEFDLFCAFLEGDYEVVMKDSSNAAFSFIAYLSVKDFEHIPNDLNHDKTGIMIGHAGSPILNHYEMVKALSEMNLTNKVLLPLSYGKSIYISALKKEISKFNNLKLECQTEYLSKEAYYKKIEDIGFFILNSFCQQALGNIVFFLLSGAKIFVRKNTSTYQTLKKQTFFIYCIEEDLKKENLTPLSLDEKRHNNQLMSEILGEDKIKHDWLKILNFNS